uniref:Uncharacterized protein n=1 Tax=Trypanosoma vivax (strain Y486) TaxID=1055687 RepID=G0U6Q0_TRYVY|nr:hypothetical protein TVY486_1006050 [Trypanosoma vivax Y486]
MHLGIWCRRLSCFFVSFSLTLSLTHTHTHKHVQAFTVLLPEMLLYALLLLLNSFSAFHLLPLFLWFPVYTKTHLSFAEFFCRNKNKLTDQKGTSAIASSQPNFRLLSSA